MVVRNRSTFPDTKSSAHLRLSRNTSSLLPFPALIYVFCILMTPAQSLAWGRIAHEAIAVLAEKNLTPLARSEVYSLLGADKMRDASLWPDGARYTEPWRHTRDYHFTSTPDNQSYSDELEALPRSRYGNGDAMRAMVKAEDLLRDPKTSRNKKIIALKFLIHVVGDIHQPLHTGRPEDRGGNMVSMPWFGSDSNLHAVWDSDIIESLVSRSKGQSKGKGKGKDSIDAYFKLLPQRTEDEIQRWQQEYYAEWHAESVAIRNAAYDDMPLSNEHYLKKKQDEVNTRVQQAGFRLAAVLNSIYTGEPDYSAQASRLRENLADILGPRFNDTISFRPYQGGDKGSGRRKKGLAEDDEELDWFLEHEMIYAHEFGSDPDASGENRFRAGQYHGCTGH